MEEQQLQHLRAAAEHPGQLKQFVLQLTCLTLFDLVKELFTHFNSFLSRKDPAEHKACVHLVCLEFINVRAPGQRTAVSTALSRPHYHHNKRQQRGRSPGATSQPPRTGLGQSDWGLAPAGLRCSACTEGILRMCDVMEARPIAQVSAAGDHWICGVAAAHVS